MLRLPYRKPIHTASQQRNDLATQNFEQLWRPIWGTAASENLESRWIKEIRSILQSHAPVQATESVVTTAEVYYNSIKKKKNWSDKITNFWIKKLTALHLQIATALREIINKELSLPSKLQEGRCIMIPKKKEPAAKRPTANHMFNPFAFKEFSIDE